MATYHNSTFQNSVKLFFNTSLILLFFTSLITPQMAGEQSVVLNDYALQNYRNNLMSDNYGIVKSSIYFAGKYRICEVCPELLKIVKKSNDEELCQLAIWSLYQIKDNESCYELNRIIKEHPFQNLVEYCKFLEGIREYEHAIIVEYKSNDR